MRSVVTAKIKITTTPEIVRLVKWHTRCLQICVDVAWKKKITNNIKLHKNVYHRIRKHLPSQTAISCIKQAVGIVKKAKTKPIIKNSSPRFNFPRNANIKNNVLILRLIKDRQQFPFTIPKHFINYFTWDVSESLLKIDKKGRTFFFFTFSKEVDVKDNTSQCSLGIDLGVNNLAVTSDNRFFNSSKVKQKKRKFKYLRDKLQAKGTRSAKRLLKKISGRETRYMTWINHNISKNIVTGFSGNKIIMEDLKGIRKKNRGRKMNYWISNWSFFQLQSFIEYKSILNGIEFVKVKPNYTSQICHQCGQIGTRIRGHFSCSHCGLHNFNSDLNASRNLAHPMLGERQVAVTRPYNRDNDVEGGTTAFDTESMVKTHAF